MANLPKIYGHCDAGCRWETVHKSDFVRAVQYVEIPMTDYGIYFEVGNKYKIYSHKHTVAGTVIYIDLPWVYFGEEAKTSLPTTLEADEYRDYYYFELLDAQYEVVSSGSTIGNLKFTYEVNGSRQTTTIENVLIGSSYKIKTKSANKVFLYNTDAVELIGANGEDGKDGADGADGKSAYDIAVENGYTGTETQFGAALVKAAGSTGWTDEQITLLETILANIAYADESTGQTAAENLIASLRGGATSDRITQSGSVLKISALKNAPEQLSSVLYIS